MSQVPGVAVVQAKLDESETVKEELKMAYLLAYNVRVCGCCSSQPPWWLSVLWVSAACPRPAAVLTKRCLCVPRAVCDGSGMAIDAG
jgi:hypothetical protein